VHSCCVPSNLHARVPAPVPAEGLSIGQAAEACGLTIDTLRYWERAGLTLWPTPRAASGQRRYRERDLSWLMSLVMLRETGMSIAEIREVAELERRQDTQEDLLAVFEQHRDRVVQRLATAHGHLRAIEAKIAYFQAAVEQDAGDIPRANSV
jgi:DNA-binding transcriptional MerR regulator